VTAKIPASSRRKQLLNELGIKESDLARLASVIDNRGDGGIYLERKVHRRVEKLNGRWFSGRLDPKGREVSDLIAGPFDNVDAARAALARARKRQPGKYQLVEYRRL